MYCSVEVVNLYMESLWYEAKVLSKKLWLTALYTRKFQVWTWQGNCFPESLTNPNGPAKSLSDFYKSSSFSTIIHNFRSWSHEMNCVSFLYTRTLSTSQNLGLSFSRPRAGVTSSTVMKNVCVAMLRVSRLPLVNTHHLCTHHLHFLNLTISEKGPLAIITDIPDFLLCNSCSYFSAW